MEKEDYIKKWLHGTLDEEEKIIFEKTEEYKSLQKLSASLMSFKAPDYNTDSEYERFRSRTPSKGKVVAVNWLNPFLKIAAVLLVMVGVFLLFNENSPTVVETLAAEKTELRLPDSSFVALSAFSKLSFFEKKWKKNRTVELDGEAFFKVAKGSKFKVETSVGSISVLGTEFNVRNRKDYFEVMCYEGLVEVQSSQKVVQLQPKQMFRIISGVITKDSIAMDNAPVWRVDESSFRSVPFLHVMQEFERQYNVSLTTKNVDTLQLFTGTFTHVNMPLALKSISIPLNLTFHMEKGKKILLTGATE